MGVPNASRNVGVAAISLLVPPPPAPHPHLLHSHACSDRQACENVVQLGWRPRWQRYAGRAAAAVAASTVSALHSLFPFLCFDFFSSNAESDCLALPQPHTETHKMHTHDTPKHTHQMHITPKHHMARAAAAAASFPAVALCHTLCSLQYSSLHPITRLGPDPCVSTW